MLLPPPKSIDAGSGGGGVVSDTPTAVTLGGILRGSTVIEYPQIEVVLAKDRKYFPSLVEEVVSSDSDSDSDDSDSDGSSSSGSSSSSSSDGE